MESQLEWTQDPFWERSQEQEASVTSQLCNSEMVTASPTTPPTRKRQRYKCQQASPGLSWHCHPVYRLPPRLPGRLGLPGGLFPRPCRSFQHQGGEGRGTMLHRGKLRHSGRSAQPCWWGRGWGQVFHTLVSEGSLSFPPPGFSPSTRVGLVTATVQVDQSKFSTCFPEKVRISSLV